MEAIETYLISHRDILIWSYCTGFLAFWQVWYRERAIRGMEASNKFWEGHEQTIYWSQMGIWPIVFYAAFIKDVSLPVWYFMGFLIGFSLLGKSILDYAFAFFGKTVPKSEPVTVVTETKTETETTVK